jgi:N-methylhydantoinase A
VKLRVGVDVGGTFTDVVAVDAATREPVACVKIPTTHRAPEGVAAGVVAGIRRLLAESCVEPRDVAFIAHSTTQATNALLEGDLARVGVVGLLDGMGWFVKRHIRFPPVPVAAGALFAPDFAFARAREPGEIRRAVDDLIAGGVQAIAATQAFGVDRPDAERRAVCYARERGIEATSGHDVSAMYGLRTRTRTAALNAAILPRMVTTARMTEQAVRDAAIPAPLMIMRSDGGVMNVGEIERRPILTMLSGPAAGVAGALLYEHLCDGIFIEVGGTSSDCSVILKGKPQLRPARIGGHRTMLQTLDVRTLGIAGGSMIRVDPNGAIDAGPRSAHIAGCAYASFTDESLIDGARVETFAPAPGDPAEYVALVARDGSRIALTVTCAANALGCVPSGAFSSGNARAARRGFALLAERIGRGDAGSLARAALDAAARKLRGAIEELIGDYRLERSQVTLLGGGGGAGAIVPYTAGAMELPYRIARDAAVIAPLGVALALVRDVVERTIVAPQPADVARIRREALDRAIAAGAAPDRVEVEIHIDAQRSLVRAIASGSTELAGDVAHALRSDAQRRAVAALALGCHAAELDRIELTDKLVGYRFGRTLQIVDERGAIVAVVRDPHVTRATAAQIERCVHAAVEAATRFGDVGRSLPVLYALRGARLVVYDGLTSAEQAAALVAEELSGVAAGDPVVLLAAPRAA